MRRAVVWLSGAVKKPVLKLVDEDYSEHGMAELLTEQGPAYDLNIRIFNQVQHTITGWPGGKPHADDTHRPERAQPSPKRVVVLSPEPSDDVLGMGGTIRRLVDHKNDVTVVYQTSGNLAVPDEETNPDEAADPAMRVLGFHWTKVHRDERPPYGEVYVVAANPKAAGRGLGTLLTNVGLRHLATQGVDEVILYVDGDNDPAIAVYEGQGFTTVRTEVQYRGATGAQPSS